MSDTVIRAVTLPVAAPVGRSWEELRPVLHASWRLSTGAANWCVHELFRRDTPGLAKVPDAVKQGRADKGRFYAYGEAAKLPWFGDWAGAKQSLNICLQYAHRKYLAERFAVLVRHESRLLTVRYPYPFPVDADAWRPSYAPGGFPAVSLTLPGGERFELRLKRRADFGRQLAMFRQLHDGTAGKGEAAVYRNGKGDVLLKLVGKFPRRDPVADRVHACFLHTDPAALLVAEIDGLRPWILNADHLKRLQAAHRVYRQRMSEDLKREKRMDPRQRAAALKSLDARCEKHRHRIDTALHQLSAQVARFCQRQRVATVAYDDSVKSYMPDGFAWHRLKERVAYKLDGMGVEFLDGSRTPQGV